MWRCGRVYGRLSLKWIVLLATVDHHDDDVSSGAGYADFPVQPGGRAAGGVALMVIGNVGDALAAGDGGAGEESNPLALALDDGRCPGLVDSPAAPNRGTPAWSKVARVLARPAPRPSLT
jgi:hypothetical protein